jgi:pimeloyl-ACP methyl ester carboxylesterase
MIAAAAALVVGIGVPGAPAAVPEPAGLLPAAVAAVAAPAAAAEAAIPAKAAGQEPWYLDQRVAWKKCKGNGSMDCATIQVPLDWANPDGDRIKLALNRLKSSTRPAPKGSMLINPGGPGASGKELAEMAPVLFSQTLLKAYDVVGFDPRGVGDSTAVKCVSSPKQLDKFNAANYPLTPKGRKAAIAAAKVWAARCAKLTGPLLGHVDSASVARDMDAIRAALGEAKLTYFGFSYGTKLGALYAELFPDNVGRMVLDGAMDPAKDSNVMSFFQLKGFQSAFKAFAKWCVTKQSPGCFSGRTVKQVTANSLKLMKQAQTKPLKSGKRTLTAQLLLTALIYPLYSESLWPDLDFAIGMALDGDGSELLWAADAYNSRRANGTYEDNSTEAFVAVGCLDYNRKNMSLAQAKKENRKAAKVSPVLGRIWVGNGIDPCMYWKYPQAIKPHKVKTTTKAPIVIVGTTNDPATPFSLAKSLAKQLPSSRLLTYAGEGHTAYGGSYCVNSAVDDYLIHGKLPPPGKTC